jgi:NAD(P)-dependent dehydrogenase (short-subunit alcohol dehydrogenase family)
MIPSHNDPATAAVNLTGAFLCARAAFGQMRARGGGRIVLVSSLSGVYATEKFPGLIASNASKHGVRDSWRTWPSGAPPRHLGDLGQPGRRDTKMLHAANQDLRASLTPDDVARLISDLLDGSIEAMSGVNVPLFSSRRSLAAGAEVSRRRGSPSLSGTSASSRIC